MALLLWMPKDAQKKKNAVKCSPLPRTGLVCELVSNCESLAHNILRFGVTPFNLISQARDEATLASSVLGKFEDIGKSFQEGRTESHRYSSPSLK